MTRINIELPEDLHKKIKIACAVNETTIKEYIRLALEKKIKEGGK